MNPMGGRIGYFSGHGDWEADYKGYTYYWLEVGEEKTYQLGFFLNDPNGRWGGKEYLTSVDSGLLLGFTSNSNGYVVGYVDLET